MTYGSMLRYLQSYLSFYHGQLSKTENIMFMDVRSYKICYANFK